MIKLVRLMLVVVGLLLAIVCNAYSAEGWPTGVLNSPNGRFVLGQINQLVRDQFLLDTYTGKVWRLSLYEKDNPNVAFYPVPFIPIELTDSFNKNLNFQYAPDTSKTIDSPISIKKK